ncbi:hypothetical protein BCR36DRAFT_356169 [Piromyces finnis]|uniref:Carbohydrate-binding domain-containing protein n=1 Tax=Piromyces finnis TaxID=1754191 RepID=A0A1Y1V403_9FUNG|nr:hypothetical protein BCR36DRAFT_356169 [Piromyces finnis]|eukprot:ORX46829.1 hypothetical protein BCR36DRAFT_356169 [Piromyces finnis]
MKFNKQLINTLLTIFLFNSVNAENQGEELILTPGPISGKYDSIDLEELYDEKSIGIHCNGNSCISTGSSVLVEEGKVTITNAGTYIFDGDLKGQLNVKAKKNDFVHLVLRNATISSDNGPAFYGEKAKKIIITTEGENVFNDSTNYPAVAVSEDAAEDETKSPNACIYVNDNLTFNGKGSLSVDGKFDEAIRSKKAIKFVSGKIDVNAKGKGIKAKNSISIKEADINVKAGNSGIKVTKDDDPEKGFIVIDGGKVVVKCDNDGIHAETHLSINGGYIEVKECAEGIEGQMIDITDGDIVLETTDDGINASKIPTGGKKKVDSNADINNNKTYFEGIYSDEEYTYFDYSVDSDEETTYINRPIGSNEKIYLEDEMDSDVDDEKNPDSELLLESNDEEMPNESNDEAYSDEEMPNESNDEAYSNEEIPNESNDEAYSDEELPYDEAYSDEEILINAGYCKPVYVIEYYTVTVTAGEEPTATEDSTEDIRPTVTEDSTEDTRPTVTEEEITVTEYYATTIAVEEEPTQTEEYTGYIRPVPTGIPIINDPFKDPKGPPVKSRKNDKQVYIRVTGGKLRLYVDGFNTDGLDANGSLYIGGNAQIYIDNAEGDIFGNMCALDSDGSNTIDNGATVIVAAAGLDTPKPPREMTIKDIKKMFKDKTDEELEELLKMFNGGGPAGPAPEGPIPEGPIPEGPIPEGPIPAGPKPEDNSYIKQPYLRTLFNYEKEIGDEIVVKDSKGEIIHTYKPRTKFTEVLVTSPKIIEGETYSVIYGDHIRTLEAKVDYEEPVYPDDEI